MERRELIFDPVDAGGASVVGLAFDSQDDSLVVQLADGSLKHYALASLALGLQGQEPASWTEPLVGATGGALPDAELAIGLDTGAVMLGRAGDPTRLDANADPEALIEQACRIANGTCIRLSGRSSVQSIRIEDVPAIRLRDGKRAGRAE
jgi:hypothetical protein